MSIFAFSLFILLLTTFVSFFFAWMWDVLNCCTPYCAFVTLYAVILYLKIRSTINALNYPFLLINLNE